MTASSSATFAANRVASRISMIVDAADGRSRCARIYEDGALRVRFPNDDHLQAIVVNTAGGIAGGDRLSFDVAVEDDAALTITTAAAEKAYRSLGEDAALDVSLKVGRRATLRWLPQETILFNEARLKRSIEVDLADDARLLLAEGVIFGRTAMREAVRDGALSDRWRVRRSDRLIFADTLRIDGKVSERLARRAIAGGGCAIATVLAAPADDAHAAAVRAGHFAGEVGISSWNGITLARLVANDGEALRHDLKAIVTMLAGELPRIWLN
jgi:urease accessory protein